MLRGNSFRILAITAAQNLSKTRKTGGLSGLDGLSWEYEEAEFRFLVWVAVVVRLCVITGGEISPPGYKPNHHIRI